ncbi:MAG: hypothetical protein ABSE73_15460, partial [Planctomycetota bacterium]
MASPLLVVDCIIYHVVAAISKRETVQPQPGVHVSKCTAGVPPARGRPAGREDEGGRDARGTLWATHLL